MQYLRLNKSQKVRISDILYVRKVRENEALVLDRDGPIEAPRTAAVIVMRDRSKGRIVTPVSFETIMERMAFVDVGGNRYVPVINIEELGRSPEEFEGKRFRSVWVKGSVVLSSELPLHVLEARLEEAITAQIRYDEIAERSDRVKKKLLARVARPKVDYALRVQAPEYGLVMAA